MGASISPLAIEATGLRKAFGEHVVLDEIHLRVEEGSVFALLGPNGAGKSTTINILSTLMEPDGGEVRVGGHSLEEAPDEVRATIGVTGQFAAADSLLTGQENLTLMADLWHLDPTEGRRRIDDLIAQFELSDARHKPVSTYSGGMRRRLDLAMTLVGRPGIIFLDEPTTGLDPRSRRVTWQIIRDLVRDGVTIFLTTQYLEEADSLADRIAILDRGRIVAQGTSEELKRLIPGGHISLRFADLQGLESAATVFAGAARVNDSLVLRVPGDGSTRALRSLLQRLDDASVEVDSVSVHTPDLDDVFLALTGQATEAKEKVQ